MQNSTNTGSTEYATEDALPPTRSELLVHWTGKELSSTSEFVERLHSLYRNGLYYSECSPDWLQGFGRDRENQRQLPTLPMICFTELQLRHARRFSREYGRLGLVFHRDYLMKNGGANPVFYLQSGPHGIVNTLVLQILDQLQQNAPPIPKTFPLRYMLAHCKPMGGSHNGQRFFEEHEWRMTASQNWTTDGTTVPPEYSECLDSPTGRSFKFSATEVKAIVFPDVKSRRNAIEDPRLLHFFKEHTPSMIDLELLANV